MKFSSIIAALVAAVGTVSAFEAAEGEKPHSIAFIVDYSIVEYPEITETDVVELTNGNSITLNYQAVNNEETEVTIIGVSGTFLDPTTGKVLVNLTAGQVGPLTVQPGESESFNQKIPLNVLPANYKIVPQLFVAHEDKVKHVAIRSQLATIVDAPVSIFNPQLLFLELILLASAAGLGYFVYQTWGKQYFQGTAPVASSKLRAVSPSSEGSATGGKAYDESWIPEGHLKQKKQKKAF
ncbi:increased recombination centers protein 22 [Scheffersomyces xylosifermentans]|uniref:increased recombination centers protein 22 n=1 Tax=Scheffersomyces xylosifermentans TaxID=1304137 RepID=UPI00315D913B